MTNGEKGQNSESEEEEIGKLLMEIMEDYQDSVIPPLKEFSPLKGVSRKRGTNEEAAGVDGFGKERKRREKMNEKFSLLQSQIPSLSSMPKAFQATKEKIVTEAIKYIENLEEEKKRLEGLKKSLLEQKMVGKPVLSHCINSKPSVSVNFCNGLAFFGIQLMVKKGLLMKIFSILEKHQAEVLVATILVNDHGILTLTCEFKVKSSEVDVIAKIKEEILSL